MSLSHGKKQDLLEGRSSERVTCPAAPSAILRGDACPPLPLPHLSSLRVSSCETTALEAMRIVSAWEGALTSLGVQTSRVHIETTPFRRLDLAIPREGVPLNNEIPCLWIMDGLVTLRRVE